MPHFWCRVSSDERAVTSIWCVNTIFRWKTRLISKFNYAVAISSDTGNSRKIALKVKLLSFSRWTLLRCGAGVPQPPFSDRDGREAMFTIVTCLWRRGDSTVVLGNRNVTTTCPRHPGHCDPTEWLWPISDAHWRPDVGLSVKHFHIAFNFEPVKSMQGGRSLSPIPMLSMHRDPNVTIYQS